ncbi:MAG: FAD-dependent oxidoreductase [Actinobacteria bacterium]|nr:FAD-dependent oxidoreductase [Actinomycetota bacterium]MCB8995689.1 FAD-dependent oxidoreductase [Actinomycetota bacterium]HRY11375.1 FAD-dependent oxidoreductase [Candidatus Nanopelagicales bacterium]
MPFAQTAGQRARAALKDARHTPYWLAQPARPEPRPPLEGQTTADLVVVGAGLSGLWTALRAKQRRPDLDVILLEGGRIANAASGRNGGFVAASITHGHLNGIERWPDEFATLNAMGVANLRGIEQTIEEFGIDCGYRRSGELQVVTEPYQLEHAADHVRMATDHGVELSLWNAERTQAEVHSPTYFGAIHDPEVGIVDPARLSWGLARAAEQLGVRIHENSGVEALQPSAAGMTVRTFGGRVETPKVALTTAAHAPLLKRLNLFVVPVFDHVVMTAPLPADVRAAIGWEQRQGIGDSGNQFHYYRLTDDDRILFGGYDAVYAAGERPGSHLERDDELTARLVQHLHDTFPQVADVPIEYAWAGAIDTCSRFSAFWGSAYSGRVGYVIGFTGLGVGASRFGADTLLDGLFKERTDRTALKMVRSKPLPFPPEPARQLVIDMTRRSLAKADEQDGQRDLWLRTLDRLGLGFDS